MLSANILIILSIILVVYFLIFFLHKQSGMTVKNMSFKVGQRMTIVGVPRPDPSK